MPFINLKYKTLMLYCKLYVILTSNRYMTYKFNILILEMYFLVMKKETI